MSVNAMGAPTGLTVVLSQFCRDKLYAEGFLGTNIARKRFLVLLVWFGLAANLKFLFASKMPHAISVLWISSTKFGRCFC